MGNSVGLHEELRGLMEVSGNSGNSDHPFWRTQAGTQAAPPLGSRWPEMAELKVLQQLGSAIATKICGG